MTPASTAGGGANAHGGSRRATDSSNQAPQYTPSCVLGQTDVRFVTIPHCRTTSADSRHSLRIEDVSKDVGRAVEREVRDHLERLAAEVRRDEHPCGGRLRAGSALGGRRRGSGSISTATTRAPARASATVSAPLPAPRSRTRSPGRIPAARTSSAASLLLRRKCRPRPRAARGRTATEGHHAHSCHHSTVLRRFRRSRSSPRSRPAPAPLTTPGRTP